MTQTIDEASREMLVEYAKYVAETVADGTMPYDFEDWQQARAIETSGL